MKFVQCNVFSDQPYSGNSLGAVNLSAQMVTCLRRMLSGENVTQESSGMTVREWREFEAVIREG